MSDMLAKCDWDGDELHVELPQWPEVVYVWVDEKTMPYAPVVADVRSLQAENAKLQAEIAELEGTIECLKGLAEATGEENAKLREERDHWHVEQVHAYGNWEDAYRRAAELEAESAKLRNQLEEQKCFAADLERDVRALRELARDMWEFMTTPCNDYCERCVVAEECSERQDYDCCQWRDEYVKRMRKLGVDDD